MSAPVIQSVFPSDGATGAVLGTTVWAIFDQEVDEEKLEGAFFVVGPDHTLWTGPDQIRWNKLLMPEPEELLESPGYTGIVQGTWSIEKIDGDGDPVSAPSYSGVGGYRDKAIFTPNEILAATIEYTVFIAGRESTSTSLRGVRSRTVWDPQLGSNLGDGTLFTTGSYTGDVAKQLVVIITGAGGQGVATYEWHWAATPGIVHTGICSEQERPFEDGVGFYFTGTDFRANDTFTINVTPGEVMADISTWSFTTGTGSIETVPSTTSTSPTGEPALPVPPYVTAPFAVSEISPTHRDTDIPLERKEIIVLFTQDIDPTTITQDTVKLFANHVLGDYDGNDNQGPGEIAKALTVSGNTLTITI